MATNIKQSLKKERLKNSDYIHVVFVEPKNELPQSNLQDKEDVQPLTCDPSGESTVPGQKVEDKSSAEHVNGIFGDEASESNVSQKHVAHGKTPARSFKDWPLTSLFENKKASDAVVYLFGDVREELVFAASKLDENKMSFGLLCGGLFEDDVSDANNSSNVKSKQSVEYIEISAFRDIFPVSESLDYAVFLRRDKSLLNTTDYGCVTGMVCLTRNRHVLTLEDVFLMRTYFNLPWQVFLLISGDGEVACYRMDDDGLLNQMGFYVVTLHQDVVNNEDKTAETPSQNA